MLMQGMSDPNPELLDAMALCGHLVARDSVYWFLAEHRQRLFLMRCSLKDKRSLTSCNSELG